MFDEKMKASRHDTWKELNPDKHLIGDSADVHIQNKIIFLVGEIIRSGIHEYGVRWLDMGVGKYWCHVGNANASYIKNKINQGVKPLRPKNYRS